MTPDRSFAPEVMAMNLVPYLRSLQKRDVVFTVTFRLTSVRREGEGLLATVGSDYGGVSQIRSVDQVVVNHGTRPLDELYFALKPLSSNRGAVDYDALIAGLPQPLLRGKLQPEPALPAPTDAAGLHDAACAKVPADAPEGFMLFRIGDAVSARNTHAAIYDALRLVKDL
jgi:hypothetical protein